LAFKGQQDLGMGKLSWQMIGYQVQISSGVILAAVDCSFGKDPVKNDWIFCFH
jgi:hypothetical protein